MYELTEEQRMVQQAIRKIVSKEIEPKIGEIDKIGDFPFGIAKMLIDHGFHLLPLPEEYGGYDSVLMNCLGIEELSKASIVVGYMLGAPSSVVNCFKASKNEVAKKKYLKRLADGEFPAFCISEPDAGSDVGAIRTKAVLEGDEYVINGGKCFVTQGGVADFYVLFAKLSPEKGLDGIGAFVVDRKTEGVNIERKNEQMGQHCGLTADISLTDVRVPKENLLGGEGEGIKLGFEAINPTRLYVASTAFGAAEAALDYATRYAKERVAFGRKISEFQAVQMLLAEMAMRIEASRSLLYRVASMMDDPKKKERTPGFAALTKCFVTEKALEVANYAMDVLGGHGYMMDHPLERIMRDIKSSHYMEGTNQVARLHTARGVLSGTINDSL